MKFFELARSLIPASLSAVDKTMEDTFMKFAKSSGNNTTNPVLIHFNNVVANKQLVYKLEGQFLK